MKNDIKVLNVEFLVFIQCNMFHVTYLQFNYKYWFIIPQEYTEAELSFVFENFLVSPNETWKINNTKVFHNFEKYKWKLFQIMGTH